MTAETFLSDLFPQGVKRVLLVSPPDADAELFRWDVAKRGRYTNYPPYGLGVLARHLREEGVEVRICNLNHEILKTCGGTQGPADMDFDKTWQDRLDGDLASFKPDLVGMTCMFTMTHGSFKTVCRRVKGAGYPLVVGGVHVSNDLDRILDDMGVGDIAITGEGEIALRRLMRVINDGADVDILGQTVLNTPEGRLKFDGDLRPKSEDISVLPALDLMEVEALSRFGVIGAFYCFKSPDTRFATVLSNRGCRGSCTFCSVRSFNGKGVRQRSISSVVDEMQKLAEDHGIGHIMWLDDDLFKDERRAVALFNEIAKRNLDMTWDATNGVIAGSCTDEVIGAAEASGCIALNLGMESGNPDILKSVRKPGTVETFLKAAEVLRRYERIHSSVFLMVGFPNETLSMIQDTIDVASKMDLDWCRISQLHPLPNTPIYDSMVAQGLIQPVGTSDLRFNGGAFGKQTEIEQGLRMVENNFKDAFADIGPNQVPNADQLTDIWFFMNYHLNFHRIFHETRPEKIQQLRAHLRTLADVISPENGFALYFQAYLQYVAEGEIDQDFIQRLRQRLETSDYWSDRFATFGLSVEDLVGREFKNKNIPSLVSGRGT